MEFAVATVEFWERKGFFPVEWHKTLDGTKAILHLCPYALIIVPDARTNPEVTVYSHEAALALMETPEWTEVI